MSIAPPRVDAIIDGASTPTLDYVEDIDPSTGEVLALIARCGQEEVDAAVSAATTAGRIWSARSVQRRSDVLRSISAILRERCDEFALLESTDTGKPLSQALADVRIAERYFSYYASVLEGFSGSTIPLSADVHAYTVHEPLGVTAHITAWNYPLQLFARSVAPALAAGNSVVVKPAEEACLSVLRLGAYIVQDCALPDGALNILPGLGVEVGAALAAHSGIDHLTFVGSRSVGTTVAAAAAASVVPVTLELGGKSPNIVFADADLHKAADTITRSILQNAGQTCSAASRVLVEKGAHAELVRLLVERFETVRIGPGPDDLDLGPLISESQRTGVLAELSAVRGGSVVTGGTVPSAPRLAAGFFLTPALVDNADPREPIAQNEIFGPVLTVTAFDDVADAIDLANCTPYGLIAGVWTRDMHLAHIVAREVRAGQMYVNTYGTAGGVELPFGGVKASGYGRQKGVQALAAFSQLKTVVENR